MNIEITLLPISDSFNSDPPPVVFSQGTDNRFIGIEIKDDGEPRELVFRRSDLKRIIDHFLM